jgi:hypothetical protein
MPCVDSLAGKHSGLFILGDPFFRSVLAVHDLRDLSKPRVGLAPRNEAYQHQGGGSSRRAPQTRGGVVKIGLKRQERAPESAMRRTEAIGRLGVSTRYSLQYTADIEVLHGEESQTVRVLLDTGSSALAVIDKCYAAPTWGEWAAGNVRLILAGAVIAVSGSYLLWSFKENVREWCEEGGEEAASGSSPNQTQYASLGEDLDTGEEEPVSPVSESIQLATISDAGPVRWEVSSVSAGGEGIADEEGPPGAA